MDEAQIAALVKSITEQVTANLTEQLDKQREDFGAQVKGLESAYVSVSAENERLRDSKASVIREKRVLEGRDPDKVKTFKESDFILTADEARNPVVYQERKRLAEKHGHQLRILEPGETPQSTLPDRYENETHLFVSADYLRRAGHAAYRRERDTAERTHKHLVVVTGPDQMPKEALTFGESA